VGPRSVCVADQERPKATGCSNRFKSHVVHMHRTLNYSLR
jgi:hypothetical protein